MTLRCERLSGLTQRWTPAGPSGTQRSQDHCVHRAGQRMGRGAEVAAPGVLETPRKDSPRGCLWKWKVTPIYHLCRGSLLPPHAPNPGKGLAFSFRKLCPALRLNHSQPPPKTPKGTVTAKTNDTNPPTTCAGND